MRRTEEDYWEGYLINQMLSRSQIIVINLPLVLIKSEMRMFLEGWTCTRKRTVSTKTCLMNNMKKGIFFLAIQVAKIFTQVCYSILQCLFIEV